MWIPCSFAFRFFFFFNDTATTEIYTLSLHDALPILTESDQRVDRAERHPVYDVLQEMDHASYFLGCSPAGTPCRCPVVAAFSAEVVAPAAGAWVGVGVVPGAGLGAVFPSVFFGWSGFARGASAGFDSFMPSGWMRPENSYLPPLPTLRTTAGLVALRLSSMVMSPVTPR